MPALSHLLKSTSLPSLAGRLSTAPAHAHAAIVAMVMAASAAVLSPLPALAQDFVRAWPAKPVMIVIPFTPGGSTDTEGRLYTQKMGENLGRSFVMDYKPGAATTIGTAYVAKAPPDGYTLLAVTVSYSLAAALQKDLPYDPLRDITPLSMMTQRPSLLVVSPQLPVKSVADYIAYVKANPDKLNFGSYGVGSGPHVGAVWLHSLLGTSVTYVHYKGQSPLSIDLTAGRIDATTGSFFANMPLHRSGKVRILAVSTPQRSPQYPEFPTLAESGATGYDYGSWWGFLGPGRMLPALAARISSEMEKAGKAPDVAKKMTDDGAIMVLSTPEQFRKHVGDEITRLKKLVADNNIKPEE
jgi:tripartite-type tricarboxylate transporter receptor subunit TctC